MTQTATKTQKHVKITNRYELKTNGQPNGYVVYVVRSSNGVDRYETTLLNGKATGCTCPSYIGCYHRAGCEAKEAERVIAQAVAVVAAAESEWQECSLCTRMTKQITCGVCLGERR